MGFYYSSKNGFTSTLEFPPVMIKTNNEYIATRAAITIQRWWRNLKSNDTDIDVEVASIERKYDGDSEESYDDSTSEKEVQTVNDNNFLWDLLMSMYVLAWKTLRLFI